jgi:hypothetical protein
VNIFIRTEHIYLVKQIVTENSVSGLLLLMFWIIDLHRRNIGSPGCMLDILLH